MIKSRHYEQDYRKKIKEELKNLGFAVGFTPIGERSANDERSPYVIFHRMSGEGDKFLGKIVTRNIDNDTNEITINKDEYEILRRASIEKGRIAAFIYAVFNPNTYNFSAFIVRTDDKRYEKISNGENETYNLTFETFSSLDSLDKNYIFLEPPII